MKYVMLHREMYKWVPATPDVDGHAEYVSETVYINPFKVAFVSPFGSKEDVGDGEGGRGKALIQFDGPEASFVVYETVEDIVKQLEGAYDAH